MEEKAIQTEEKNLHKETQKIKPKGNSIKVLQKWKNNMPVKDLRIWLVVCNLFYYQISFQRILLIFFTVFEYDEPILTVYMSH